MAADALEAVLALQAADTDLDRHRHRQATLPERDELARLEGHLSTLAISGAGPRGELAQVAGRQTALESDLAATEARISTVEQRMYSGEVTASRDLQAMSDDLKAQQTRRSELEDRILETMDERQPHEEAVAAIDAELASLSADQERVRAALAEAVGTIDGEIAELKATRAERASAVTPDLLATYERIRERLGGVGAARLIGDRCDGCHLTLPAAEVARIRRLPEGEVVTCEDCGRILVP